MAPGGGTVRRLVRRPGWLLAIAVALGMGVAAVGVRAPAGVGLRDGGLPIAGVVGLAVLFAFAAIGAAAKYHDHVRSTQAATPAQERLRRATSVVLSVSAVLVPFALLLLMRRSGAARRGVAPSLSARPPPYSSGGGRLSLDLGAFLVVLALVIGALVLTGLVAVAVLSLRKMVVASPIASAPVIGEPLAQDRALAGALLAGRSALVGDDARAAIIGCYAAMEASLEQVGVIRERSDTPSDLLRRATSPDLPGVAAQHAATLTGLFREARYSTHPMTARQLDQARSALDAMTATFAC